MSVSNDTTRLTPRLARERKTVSAMIRLFCRGRHGSKASLCAACGELEAYAMGRLSKCPFGEEKPNCVNCRIHCYRPQMREEIRVVMRYAGWRMMFHHPLLAFWHMLDRKPPESSGSQPAGGTR